MNEKALHFHTVQASDLTGKLMAVLPAGNAALAQIPNNPSFWVPVFDDEEYIHKWLAIAGIADYKLKQITDGLEFLASLEDQGIRVMLNPRQVGLKIRWTEVMSPATADKKYPPAVN